MKTGTHTQVPVPMTMNRFLTLCEQLCIGLNNNL